MNAVATLTLVHVAISLAGLASGFVLLWGLLTRQRFDRWTAFFLASTIATSASGFLFPVDHVTPGHVLGAISLVALAIAVFARYQRKLSGSWRVAYVASTVLAQYLNFFVLLVQLFVKVPALNDLAPTQSEFVFVAVQLLTLAAFVALGVVAAFRFRGEKAAGSASGSPSSSRLSVAGEKVAAAALFVFLGSTASLASAQYQQGFPPLYPTGYQGYGLYHHASTLEEGLANGAANLTHAAGASNLLHSQAARNYEEAYSRGLDNRLKGVQTYHEARRVNAEYRAAERTPRPTAEQMARVAKQRAPEPLGVNDLDPLTGRLEWPAVLEDDVYQANRERLDELVAKLVRFNGQLGAEDHLALQTSTKAMQADLKQRVKQYSTADYIKAKKLLDGLAYQVVRPEAALVKGESSPTSRIAAGEKLTEAK